MRPLITAAGPGFMAFPLKATINSVIAFHVRLTFYSKSVMTDYVIFSGFYHRASAGNKPGVSGISAIKR
jgi:hypothetical protein